MRWRCYSSKCSLAELFEHFKVGGFGLHGGRRRTFRYRNWGISAEKKREVWEGTIRGTRIRKFIIVSYSAYWANERTAMRLISLHNCLQGTPELLTAAVGAKIALAAAHLDSATTRPDLSEGLSSSRSRSSKQLGCSRLNGWTILSLQVTILTLPCAWLLMTRQ